MTCDSSSHEQWHRQCTLAQQQQQQWGAAATAVLFVAWVTGLFSDPGTPDVQYVVKLQHAQCVHLVQPQCANSTQTSRSGTSMIFCDRRERAVGAPREGRDEQENECQCAANIKTGRGLQRLTTG
jgi:hypothetical protein